MSKKKKTEIGNRTRRNINLNNYKKELDVLMKRGKEEYSPKIGRQAVQVKKKIGELEKSIKSMTPSPATSSSSGKK
ncbi:MAG: hypothetical protein HQK50_00265 [Oligoflexia bacterium]|nr:hypothetical protein [Oligoflexia bacterium]MBF0363968.1 hypothetical protein [Oligoflexia bacterium]